MKRFFVRIVKVVTAAVVLLGAYAGAMSSHYRIERSRKILAPARSIFPCINEIAAWEKWSPWKARDNTVVNTYEGPRSGTGALMKWSSEQSGTGSVRLDDVLPDAYVRYTITFIDWNSSAQGEFTLRNLGADTEVTWAMEGERSFFERLIWTVLGMQSALALDFDDGLERMDNYCATTERLA